MNEFLYNIGRPFADMLRKSDNISISAVRPSRLVYFMAYALELMLYRLRGFGPFNPGAGLFGLDGWTVIYIVHSIASLAVMLLWSAKFKRLIRISVAVMVIGFIPWIFLSRGYMRLALAAVAMAGLGGAVTSARCGYAFATNNAEKLFGMIMMFVCTTVLRILNRLGVQGIATSHILPILLLIMLSFCLLKFKEQDFEVKKQSAKSDAKGLYWALALFIAYFAIDGYSGILMSAHFERNFAALIVGCAVPCLIFPLLFTRFKINTWHIWNIFFAFSLAMGLCAVFAPQLGSRSPEILFCSLSRIGWPLCIYTMGCAQRRFASYSLMKKSTVVFVICSPITTLSSKLVRDFFPESISSIAFIYILVLVVAFLMLSPFSYKHLFSTDWASELHSADMSLLQEKVDKLDRFGKYELTPRQREVAALLLAAKTRRQIAGELGLSESTVKMHTSDLYRKLNINSRTELFRMFGTADAYAE